MADDTHPAGTPTTPRSFGHCAWHNGFTDDVRLIHIQEAGSGPATGGHRWACRPCRVKHGLIPLAARVPAQGERGGRS